MPFFCLLLIPKGDFYGFTGEFVLFSQFTCCHYFFFVLEYLRNNSECVNFHFSL